MFLKVVLQCQKLLFLFFFSHKLFLNETRIFDDGGAFNLHLHMLISWVSSPTKTAQVLNMSKHEILVRVLKNSENFNLNAWILSSPNWIFLHAACNVSAYLLNFRSVIEFREDLDTFLHLKVVDISSVREYCNAIGWHGNDLNSILNILIFNRCNNYILWSDYK